MIPVSDDEVRVLEESFRLIDEERALVKLEPGCQWVSLMQEGKWIGIAFIGQSSFAIDAIAETRFGAIGQSISCQLKGTQLYFGDTDINSVSRVATEEELTQSVLKGKPFEEMTNDRFFTSMKWDIHPSPDSTIFLGTDESETKIVLILSNDRIVFTHGKHVFIMKGQRMLTLDDQGVVLTGSEGVPLFIGRSGIQRVLGWQ